MPMDWIYGLIGGLMIGTAAAIYLLGNGRIMGISGILGGLLDGTGWPNWIERVAFLVGLLGVPALIVKTGLMSGTTNITDNWVLLVISGVTVGIGVRLSNECTSGHGICGLSRFSIRGISATVIYLLFGMIAMYLARHVMGVV